MVFILTAYISIILHHVAAKGYPEHEVSTSLGDAH